MRWKALAEIYTMHSFAQLCNLIFFVKILAKILAIFEQKKWDCRAVQWSASCRSRRELSNAYFDAKFGFDTADNEHLTRTI